MPLEWLIDIIKEWVITQAYATKAWVLGKDYQSGADMPEWTMPLGVTGDLIPDATSTYLKAGIRGDKPYYRRLDGEYFIWWSPPVSWIISTIPGLAEQPLWHRDDPVVFGFYFPVPPTAGNPTVSKDYGYAKEKWVLNQNYLQHGFVDRGDPAAWDWTETTLTKDNAWHDLDLSGIIPPGVKAVLFRSVIKATTVDKFMRLRKNGNVNAHNSASSTTESANINHFQDLIVAPDGDGRIEYYGNVATWTYFRLTVAGWWF